MKIKLDIADRKTQIGISILLLIGMIFFFLNINVGNNCDSGEDTERLRCWEDKVRIMVFDKGLDKTFDQLEGFYGGDPLFASNCHGILHIFGETGYEIYKEDSSRILYNKGMKECGYGFLHGFVGELILNEDNGLQKAGSFCEELGNSQTELPPETIINDCFHGIGHGVIDDQTGYGSLDSMVEVVNGALDLCGGIASNDQYLGYCKDGAFHSSSLILMENRDLKSFDVEDPLALCRLYEQESMAICHGSFSSLVMILNDNDMVKSLSYLAQISDQESAETYLRVLAAYRAFGDINNLDLDLWIKECRTAPNDWFSKCIDGLAIGLMDFSGPGEQATRSFSLCKNDTLTEAEQQTCGESVVRRTKAYLGAEQQRILCSNLDRRFDQVCSRQDAYIQENNE